MKIMSMDIDDLNKSQFILLVLLVSFVTSIATGIVTVSLMEKAPKDVVRVVQRVVERTVEKVQDEPQKNKEPKEKIIEKTIIVKEGDLIAEKIAELRPKILSIYDDEDNFVSFAFYNNSYIVADSSNTSKDKKYIAKNTKGEIFNLKFKKSSQNRALVLFELEENDAGKKPSEIKISQGQTKLGQTLFYFASARADKVLQSIISSKPDSYLELQAQKESILPGTLVFDSKGELVAISTQASRGVKYNYFIQASAVDAFVKNANKPEADNQDKTDTNQNKDSASQPSQNAQQASVIDSQTNENANNSSNQAQGNTNN